MEEEKWRLQERLDAALTSATPRARAPLAEQHSEELIASSREASRLRDEVSQLQMQLDESRSVYEARHAALQRALEAQVCSSASFFKIK